MKAISSAVCLAVLLAVSCMAASDAKKPMNPSQTDSDSSKLFARVDELWSVASLTPPPVEKLVGVHLTMVTPAARPPAPAIFTGSTAEGLFSSAELRVPTDPAASAAGLLILKLRPGLSVTAGEVLKKYGEPSGLIPPHPGAPADMPVYWVFKRTGAKGTLSFGIRDDRVVDVVLDRHPQ